MKVATLRRVPSPPLNFSPKVVLFVYLLELESFLYKALKQQTEQGSQINLGMASGLWIVFKPPLLLTELVCNLQ